MGFGLESRHTAFSCQGYESEAMQIRTSAWFTEMDNSKAGIAEIEPCMPRL